MKSKYFRIKNFLTTVRGRESGQILILASILLFLSSIMVIPLAQHISTGIKTTKIYQRNAKEIYAADRGIQHALWKIKYNSQIATDRAAGTYPTYPAYTLPTVDNNTLSVQISANWLFYYLFKLSWGQTPHDVNLTTSNIANNGVFTINFTNSQYPDGPPVQPIVIDSMGIWLPPGFSYTGSPTGITSSPPTATQVYGGTNLVWSNVGYHLGKFESAIECFNYSPAGSTPKGAASWVFPQNGSIGASWDNATWWYDVVSSATDISVSPNKITTVHAVVIYDPGTSSGLNLVSYILSP